MLMHIHTHTACTHSPHAHTHAHAPMHPCAYTHAHAPMHPCAYTHAHIRKTSQYSSVDKSSLMNIIKVSHMDPEWKPTVVAKEVLIYKSHSCVVHPLELKHAGRPPVCVRVWLLVVAILAIACSNRPWGGQGKNETAINRTLETEGTRKREGTQEQNTRRKTTAPPSTMGL